MKILIVLMFTIAVAHSLSTKHCNYPNDRRQ